jgi:AcrR family transcriptional regulator
VLYGTRTTMGDLLSSVPSPRHYGARLTRDAVIDAAAEMVAAGGFESLSMRRLARSLGVGAMTLHGYVRTKEELLGALAERFLLQAELPQDEGLSWQTQLAELFRAVRREFLDHPELVPVVAHQRLTGAGAYRGMEIGLSALRRGGLSYAQCVKAFGALTSFTMGSVQREIGLSEAGAVTFPGLQGLPTEDFSNVIRAAGLLATRDAERDFEAGLDLLIRGIETWIEDPPEPERR